MSTITVNTASDVVNASDGVTSLREAIAQAGAGDTIAFAAALDHQTIALAQGLVISHDLIIDGDRNNDGLADITLNGQSNGLAFPILTVTGGADARRDRRRRIHRRGKQFRDRHRRGRWRRRDRGGARRPRPAFDRAKWRLVR